MRWRQLWLSSTKEPQYEHNRNSETKGIQRRGRISRSFPFPDKWIRVTVEHHHVQDATQTGDICLEP